MRLIFHILIALFIGTTSSGHNHRASELRSQRRFAKNEPRTVEVLNGIDVLEKENFVRLNGLRIGLVTNQTGKDRFGQRTIDVLKGAKNVRLVALFSPEHGILGKLETSSITDSIDEKTGLPVYSLHGETFKPKPEHLLGLDALVFDMQDVGTRFYTYIATMGAVIEEAAKAKKIVFVLDRPNPINGIAVEGPLGDAFKGRSLPFYTLPLRHGLTVGEIANMFNVETKINADLRVVKVENWRRSMWYDETTLIWTNPSPNMRSLTEATLYPGIGLLETTNLSVGRGTDTPFEVVGAPFIDGRTLAAYLNNRDLEGVRFVPIYFTPNASVYEKQLCGGINVIAIDREKFKPVRTGIEIAAALRKLYPARWKIDGFQYLLGHAETFESIKRGDTPEEIEKEWQRETLAFMKRRARFSFYQ